MVEWTFNIFCPQCRKKFDKLSSVSRHLSQPNSTCACLPDNLYTYTNTKDLGTLQEAENSEQFQEEITDGGFGYDHQHEIDNVDMDVGESNNEV